jgi:hypothetical protein
MSAGCPERGGIVKRKETATGGKRKPVNVWSFEQKVEPDTVNKRVRNTQESWLVLKRP